MTNDTRNTNETAAPQAEAAELADQPSLMADEITSAQPTIFSGEVEESDGNEITGAIDRAPSLPYPIVAFGSSAGGLQPIKDILSILPEDTGMAFILVPHLAADQVSYLKEITEQYTAMPVHPIAAGEQPRPNRVYVLQPNQVAQIRRGRFVTTERAKEQKISHVIDLFFHSLGEDMQDRAVGVVLSGADADGTLGLKTIRGEGGLAIAQKPETAQYSSMPRTSIAMDHIDLVLSPREIGVELARLAKQFVRPDVQILERGEELTSDQEGYQRILQMLRSTCGLELRQYKQETIRRRIARRMMLLRTESLADYVRFLEARKDELTNLQEDVLIGVTRFFRDSVFWEALSTQVLPTFFEHRAASRAVRVWCAGCSTGEEVYSFAISFLEYMTAHGLDNTLQIFGTDASERSIEMARQATYPDSIVGEMSSERLRRFFVKVDRGYQLSKRVRDLCIFARQNLSTDPPFSHIDFLTCRNVLIYFNQSLQRQVMQTFHYALETGGYLLLGMSETLREYDDWFTPLDRKNKIYSKIGTGVPGGYRLPIHHVPSLLPLSSQSKSHPDQVWSEVELQRAGDRLVLARFAPPGLVIDEQMNVLQVRGQTAAFVELSSGPVSWSLLRVVRDRLQGTVREVAQHAIAENLPVSRLGHYTADDGTEKQVQIDVLPLPPPSSQHRCFLVLFRELEMALPQGTEIQFSPNLSADEKERMVAQLRQDLSATRFHLQSLIEERDARNQELVSANEEIQSANEELQSTNEELETTKEELQSSNEELQTVNDELQQRNAVLTQTGNDLSNLLTSVNIPLLMLTEGLEIRQFTPPLEKLLNVRSSDIGRRISEIRLQLSVEDIEPILQDVLETLGTREVEVQDRHGRWHLMRVRPYRTTENKIEGIVLVLVDIDQLRQSQQELREARDFANCIVASVPVPVVVLNSDCTIRTVNKSFRDLTKLAERELTGRSLPELARLKWGVEGFLERLNELMAREPGSVLEFEHRSTTSDDRVLLIQAQVLSSEGSRVILLTVEDITVQRRAEHELEAQKQHLEHKIEDTEERLTRAQRELQELAAYLFSVQEEERRRVARELHDDVSQRLAALSLEIARVRGEQEGAGQLEASKVISGIIDSLSMDVRQISHRLHPAILDDLGLVSALNALVDEFGEREGMFTTFSSSDVPEGVSRPTATAIYRVAQEALRNVGKHAGKTHVKVLLGRIDDRLHLEVRDFGIGFDQQDGAAGHGLGIISMKERARIAGGTFELKSDLGQGTSVVLDVPFA